MKRLRAWLIAAAAAIVLLIVAAAIALPWMVDTPRVQALITASAAQALGRPVTLGAVRARLVPVPAVELRDLQIADDPAFGPAPFLTLERGELRLRLRPLLTGRLVFGDLVLRRPVITVIQDASGRWNFATLGSRAETRPAPARPPRPGGSPAGAGAVLGSRVRLDNGVIDYVPRGGGARPGYRLEQVDLTMTPAPGVVRVAGRARVVPGDVTVTVTETTLGVDGARALTEATLQGRLAVDGREVRELVARTVGAEPTIEAGVKASFVLGGSVGQPRASGEVSLPGLRVTRTNPACPEPRRRTLAIDGVTMNVAWEDNVLAARALRGRMAGGEIATNATVTLERGAHVQFRDLAVSGVRLQPVLVDFLCQGYAVSGPLDLTGALGFDPASISSTLTGAGQLHIGRGRVVGAQALRVLDGLTRVSGALAGVLGPDAGAVAGASPLEFESITATFQAAGGVVTTPDLVYTSQAVSVTAAGRYAMAADRLDVDVALRHPRGQIQAKVTGPAAGPAVRLAPDAVLRSIDPGAVERGLQDLLRRFR